MPNVLLLPVVANGERDFIYMYIMPVTCTFAPVVCSKDKYLHVVS